MSPSSRGWRSIAAALALSAIGCGHTPPFAEDGTAHRGGPFTASPPILLTYNPDKDLYPRFVPGLPAILYTFETSAANRRDRCLGLIPPTGGVRLQEICPHSVGSRDSLDAYGPAAVSPEGRLAYVASATSGPKLNPDRSAVVVASVGAPLDTTSLHPLPFSVSGLKIDGVADLRWLDERHLAYIAQRVDYPRPCGTCKADTVRTGIGIVLADLAGASPTFSLVGGPRATTSLAIDDAGAFLYTMAGDSRVYRESPSGGTATVVFDFGADGTVATIDVAGSLLAAAVGNGIIHVVDLAAQTTLFRSSPFATFPPPVPIDNLFSRPVLVSSNQLVVEGHAIEITPNPVSGLDTTLTGAADLWLIRFRP